MELRRVNAGVLVIGGGGMAGRAAIEAHRQGARVVMVMKGKFGVSGASAFKVAEAAGYNVADGLVDPRDNPEEHFKDIVAAAAGTCDERLARIVAEDAGESLRELEQLNVPFVKDAGKYVELVGCFASRPRTHWILGHAEPIVSAQRNEILPSGVPIYENMMVTCLLVVDGTCVGACAVDQYGEIVAFIATATILATGGAGRLFALNLNPADITGDSYALGYRAGAELVNMEFMQAGLGIISPVSNVLLTESVWAWNPDLYNAHHEPFLDRYLPRGVSREECMEARSRHYPFSTYDGSHFIDVGIQEELRAGRGTSRNGIYLDVSRRRESDLADTPHGRDRRRLWDIYRERMKANRGIDIAKQPLEVACFGHAVNGGVRIDPSAESTLSCLFAGGEAAGGPHGADRLGGNMLLTCQVFGKRAGKAAAQRAHDRGMPFVPPGIIAAEVERLAGMRTRRGSLEAAELKRELQRCMSRNVLVVRSHESLQTCLAEVERLRLRLVDVDSQTPAQLVETLEVENLLTAAEIMARAALLRTESRGSHYRADYPQRDDAHWQQSIVTRLANGRMEQLPRRLPRLPATTDS